MDAPGAVPRVVVPPEDDVTAERFRYELDELLAIARALSSERDINKLLDLILAKSRQVTGADAGSVYVVEPPDDDGDGRPDKGPKLVHFMLSQNDSITIDFKKMRLPIDATSIVGKAVLDARPINIADLDRLDEPGENPWGVHHNRTFDQRSGYRARSMLTVPMLSAENEVIGVIQLINKKRHPERRLRAPADFDAEVVPFDQRSVNLALALASQAGICLENATLYKEITLLFEGFVDASVKAIESRDPTTSGHSRRVATLTVALAETVDALAEGPFKDVHFTRDDLQQIEFAGVLHDFGKVGVREHVLVKPKKLYEWQRSAVELRFRFIRKVIEAEALERKLDLFARGAAPDPAALAAVERESAARLGTLDECWKLLVGANEPTLFPQPAMARLRELAAAEYTDVDGRRRPWVEPDELAALEVPRGSLTSAERREIESHVTHTLSFLETIPWGRKLRSVPRIAGSHHELLDGSGYPRGLKGAEIPVEVRMLTISDIFDALTAADRPYKAAVPVPKALDILAGEVKAGRSDGDLFRIFVEAQVYKRVVP